MLSVCPNCGAALGDGRCPQCFAVVGVGPAGAIEPLALKDGRLRGVAVADVHAIWAMPMASTRPQSAGHGSSWWVCAAVRPTLARVVLVRGLVEAEAVRLAHAVAVRVGQTP